MLVPSIGRVGGGFIGAPDFIRDTLRRYEAAHIDLVLFIAQSGDRKHEDIMPSLELFAREVMLGVPGAPRKASAMAGAAARGVPHPVNSTI